MKIVRHGLVFIFSLYLSLVWLVGFAHFHPVIFLNQACIIPFHGYEYHTCAAIRVKVDDKKITVPKNFKTDLASIPRILWPILAPQYSGFVAPAILHDYLYRCDTTGTRQYADEVFYSALITQDITAFTAAKLYMGVRLFGESNYRKYRDSCR